MSDENDNETSELRDAIDEAVDKVETDSGETLGMAAADPEPTPAEPAEPSIPDDGGTEDEGDGEGGKPTEPEPGAEPTPEPEPIAAKGKGKFKAPVGWDAEAREHWEKIPENIQKEIAAREDEVARTIHGTLDARKTHEWLSHLSDSYAPVLAAEGVDSPAQAIEGLFKTVAELRLGSPQQKAAKVAEIISTYGIDIPTLDTVLSGQVPATGEGGGNGGVDPNLEHMIDTKLAPIHQVFKQLEDMQAGQAEGRQTAANEAVGVFSEDAEFINDVRMDMADLLDLADKNGRQLSLQQAYDKACALNPEVTKVLDERKATQALLDKKKKAVEKLNAGSSIAGAGAAGAGGEGDLSLRDQISSIWDTYTE